MSGVWVKGAWGLGSGVRVLERRAHPHPAQAPALVSRKTSPGTARAGEVSPWEIQCLLSSVSKWPDHGPGVRDPGGASKALSSSFLIEARPCGTRASGKGLGELLTLNTISR